MIRLLLVVCSCSGLFAHAGASNDWGRVRQLPAGTKVEVIHGQLKSVSGDFVSATDVEVVVATVAGSAVVRRDDVVRVKAQTRSRKKRVLIGMAVGAGAAAAAAIAGASAGDIDLRYTYIGGAAAVLGGAGGAAFGALSGGPETIYRK
jgi:hypothetical protein